MPRYINPVPQYHDSQGNILVEGFLLFEESGTNTKKDIYHDVDLTIAATNPVKLDGAGRTPSLFTEGLYKVTAYKDDGLGQPGEQQWSRDPVGDDADGFGSVWGQTSTYALEDVVQGSDGEYYISIISANKGNNPTTTPSAWSRINLIVDWNTNETYAQFDVAKGSDGSLYYSVIGSNVGNDPTTDDGTNWERGSTRPETAIQAQTTHNMASDADYTLTTSEAQKAIIKITDTGVVLTTGRNIIVPDAAREWTFVNATAQTLTPKTLSGAGVAVLAGDSDQLKSDGTDVNRQKITPATETALGEVEKATKAEMEAETADKYPDAATLTNHPGVAKAYVNFDGGATPTINKSYNVSSVSFTSTGVHVVNLSNNMTLGYVAVPGTGGAGGAGGFVSADTYAAGSFRLVTRDTSNVLANINNTTATVFGDLA